MADVKTRHLLSCGKLPGQYENKPLPVTVLRTDANGVEKSPDDIGDSTMDTDANRVVIGIIPELDTEHPVVAKTIATERQSERGGDTEGSNDNGC